MRSLLVLLRARLPLLKARGVRKDLVRQTCEGMNPREKVLPEVIARDRC
jgi:hypothetical protein